MSDSLETKHLGAYRVAERIATGGMGEIYRAVPPDPDGVNRSVAIKVIRPDVEAEPTFRTMFEAEARVAMALAHPNVVRTLEVGSAGGRHFIVMEHVDGMDLARLIRACLIFAEQPLAHEHVLLITREALKGLDHAHRSHGSDGAVLGIIHRDVKPGNILISTMGEVKIADFGVALSALRTHRSLVGTLKGKLVYMPPEQLRGDALDPRADVYAMGAVVYEMLTGRPPFLDDTPAVIPEIVAGRFPRPRVLRPELPSSLEALVLRAMAPGREARFDSAAAMAQEIDRITARLGTAQSPVDLGQQVRRMREDWQRRSSELPLEPKDHETIAARPKSMRPPPEG